MKVCKKHLKLLERGQTYQLVGQKDCILCKCDKWEEVLDALDKYGD